MDNQELIKNLVNEHVKRPWWKEPKVFLSLFFVFLGFYFLVIGIILPHRNALPFFRFSLGALITIMFIACYHFYRSLYEKPIKHKRREIYVVMIFVILSIFFDPEPVEYVKKSFDHDMLCLSYGSVMTYLPILLFIFVIKSFSPSDSNRLLFSFSACLTMFVVIVMGVFCPDNNFNHLIRGHYSAGLVSGILTPMFYGMYQGFKERKSKS